MRCPRAPTAVIASRFANVDPGARQPVVPGVSDAASFVIVRNGLVLVPVFVSAPEGAAQKLQRPTADEPPAAPAVATTAVAAQTARIASRRTPTWYAGSREFAGRAADSGAQRSGNPQRATKSGRWVTSINSTRAPAAPDGR